MIYKTDYINKYLKMLQTLQSSVFRVNEAGDKKYLVIDNIIGAAIVFFSGSDCQYCVQMRDILDRTMPAFMSRVKFFTINLSENKEVVKKSEATFFIHDTQKADIQHVPFIVFYNNGLPCRKFNGNYNVQEFSTFLEECLVAEPSRPAPVVQPMQPKPLPPVQPYYEQQQQPNFKAAYYSGYGQEGYAQRQMQHPRAASSAQLHSQSESTSVNNCSNKKFCYLSFKDAYGN